MKRKRPEPGPVSDTGRLEGLAVATYGRRLLVEDDEGRRHDCVPRGRKLRVVCGDKVLWLPGAQDAPGVVEGILPRQSELTRPDRRGRAEVLAANVDQLLVVAAPRPAFDPFLVDRYLAAAELMGIRAAVVLNKSDMESEARAQEMPAAAGEYQQVGYPVVWTSARLAHGIAALASLATGRVNIMVGQSGVGKSSLLNVLLPDARAETGRLSTAGGHGRHTTTASVLHHMPRGGALIDSPGVRDYAPHLPPDQDLSAGFAEMREPARRCRFRDCRHLEEPGCGVKAAADRGAISARRLESYRRLVRRQAALNPGFE